MSKSRVLKVLSLPEEEEEQEQEEEEEEKTTSDISSRALIEPIARPVMEAPRS